jgi:hypothetical protein
LLAAGDRFKTLAITQKKIFVLELTKSIKPGNIKKAQKMGL